MCGIAGYINKKNEYETNLDKVKVMTDKMIHRGPDAEGQWIDDKVALGHRRLSIIDLDKRSNQPMLSIDGRFVITYNGEIYNYLEIRTKLQGLGIEFKTNSDTEVIIEAYREYGTECFNMFNGMWALAIYDIEKSQVIVSRDRFGIKPLYILNNDKVFVFASEIKAITAIFPEENIMDENMVYRYLLCTSSADLDEKTFYKNIKRFPLASTMIYDLKTNNTEYIKYWDVDEKLFYDKWIKGKNPVKTFKQLFDSSIELRLRADVPVGSCLSGGIDSSAIVGCLTKKFNQVMHTFSSIYDDVDCNEKEYIEEVNKKWNAIPHYVSPDDYEKDFVKCTERITYYHDQPTGGAGMFSQYMVMKTVDGNVKVLLDGQGADELFAGYIAYIALRIYDLVDNGKFFSKIEAIRLLTIMNKYWPQRISSVSTDTIVKIVGLKNSHIFANSTIVSGIKTQRNVKRFTEEFLNKVNYSDGWEQKKLSSQLKTGLCNLVIKDSIPELMHNEDGNSMAFSIEARAPFLDYRIVEFAIALNDDYKIRNKWTKWIVRKACKEYLPNKVAHRINKMGFPAPFSRWLISGESSDEIKRIIYKFGNRNIVPIETIDAMYKAHLNKEGDYSTFLYRCLSMELWIDKCSIKNV